MKAILLLFTLQLSYFAASESVCGQAKPEWRICQTAADCKLAADACGIARVPANKQSVAEVEKFYACTRKGDTCPKETKDATLPILTCEAYGMKFRGVKAPPPVKECTRLSDIVGMAINNDDRERITAAIAEAKDTDMSLSHIHETPLTLAALNGKSELVGWLLGKGAKVNFQTKNGYTALMFAAMSGAADRKKVTDTVTLLLRSGADKALKNSRGETAMDQAVAGKREDVIKLLK